jgi:hypothetical protein
MKKIIDKIWRIVLISLTGVVVWGFSRGFVFKKLIPVVDPADFMAYGDSYFVAHGLFFPLLAIIGIIVLTWYAVAFLLIEGGLYGNRYVKGFTYGFSFFLIYMAGFFEFYHFFHGDLSQAIRAGFADGTPLLITGLLLGIFIGTDTRVEVPRTVKYLTALLFIPALFLIGRIAFYTTVYISPLICQSRSLLFIALYGATIGISYYFLSQGIKVRKYFAIPFYYALILLPISLSGNTFVCLRYRFPFSDMAILTAIDMIAIIIGGLLTELVCGKRGTVGKIRQPARRRR